jgi:hypothetical protein
VPAMPLMRYFLFVGGALLALLFVAGTYAPKPDVSAAAETAVDYLPVVRIRSDRKWPERIVFDTSVSVPAPAVTTAATAKVEADAASPMNIAGVSPTVRVRDVFAHIDPDYPKMPEPKLQQKRKIARSRIAQPAIVIAQHQQRSGFLASTW